MPADFIDPGEDHAFSPEVMDGECSLPDAAAARDRRAGVDRRISVPGSTRLGLAVALYLRVKVTRVVARWAGRLECRFLRRPDSAGPNRIEHGFDAFPSGRRGRPRSTSRCAARFRCAADWAAAPPRRSPGLRLRELVEGPRRGDEILARRRRSRDTPTTPRAALFGGVTSCCGRERGQHRRDAMAVAGAVAHRGGDAARGAARPRCRAARCRSGCRSATRSSTCSTWRCCWARCRPGGPPTCARRSATGRISRIARRLVPGLRRLLGGAAS